MQAADHEADGVDAAAGRVHKAQKTASGGRHATQQSDDHPSTTAGPSQQPAMLNGFQHRAGCLGAEGRTSSGQDAPMTDAGPVQVAAGQPAGPKITLKLKRRWSAGSEDYDDSWFAQHVDRQPHRFGPVSSLPEVSMPAVHELHAMPAMHAVKTQLIAGCQAGKASQPGQLSVGACSCDESCKPAAWDCHKVVSVQKISRACYVLRFMPGTTSSSGRASGVHFHVLPEQV